MFNQKGSIFTGMLVSFLIIVGSFIYNTNIGDKVIPYLQNNNVSQNNTANQTNPPPLTPDVNTTINPSPNTNTQTNTSQNDISQVAFSNLALNGSADIIIKPGSKIGYNVQLVSLKTVQIASVIMGVDWTGEGLSFSVIDPDGSSTVLFDAGVPISPEAKNPALFFKKNGKNSFIYSPKDPVKEGTWKMVFGNSGNKDINLQLVNDVFINIQIIPTQTEMRNLHPNMEFKLSAGVGEGSYTKLQPLKNLDVKAEIRDEKSKKIVKTVQMYDDFYNGAGVPNDGEYESRPFSLPSGSYEIYYLVSGKNLAGKAFFMQNNIADNITVSSDNAQLVGDPIDKGISSYKEGITSSISVEIGVKVNKTGDYTLTGTIISPNGEEDSAATQFSRQASDSYNNATLLFSGFNQLGLDNGVYKIKDICLSEEIDYEHYLVDCYTGGNNGVYTLKNYTIK